MSDSIRTFLRTWAFRPALCGVLVLLFSRALAQETAFSFQARISDHSAVPGATYDLSFSLCDAVTNGNKLGTPIVFPAATLADGVVNLSLDFGSAAFTGDPRWIELSIRQTDDPAGYEVLSPRFKIGTAPYAIKSANAGVAAQATLATSAVTAQTVSWTGVTHIPTDVSNLSDYLGSIFAETGTQDSITETGNADTVVWIRESPTISGWGQGVANPGDFSRVRFLIRAWDTNKPIHNVRCRIKDGDFNGVLLADRTIAVDTQTGVAKMVNFDFGSSVTVPGATVWIEYFTDGVTGQTSVGLPANGNTPRERYTTGRSVSDTSMTVAVTNIVFYVGFLKSSVSLNTSEITDNFRNELGLVASRDVAIDLPSTLEAVQGTEFNIYFDNVIRSDLPVDQLDVKVTSSVGAQFQRFWRLAASASVPGVTSLTIDVGYKGHHITSKTVTLSVAPSAAGNGVNRRLLMIGDSTTANGIMMGELARLFSTNNMKVTFVGTKGTPPALHEGITGWTFANFLTSPASPFVFNGTFDFAQYLATNKITLAPNDWVMVNLGINDIFAIPGGPASGAAVANVYSNLTTLVSGIKSVVPTARIGVCLTIPPPALQDGFGYVYGDLRTVPEYRGVQDVWIAKILQGFDGGAVPQVSLIPINANLDTFNNYPLINVPVNARNPGVTFQVPDNGVHPAPVGYYQIADTLFSFLKGNEP